MTTTTAGEFTKIYVGQHLVIGNDSHWKVMEQSGSYRMFKKSFKTSAAAVKFAEALQ